MLAMGARVVLSFGEELAHSEETDISLRILQGIVARLLSGNESGLNNAVTQVRRSVNAVASDFGILRAPKFRNFSSAQGAFDESKFCGSSFRLVVKVARKASNVASLSSENAEASTSTSALECTSSPSFCPSFRRLGLIPGSGRSSLGRAMRKPVVPLKLMDCRALRSLGEARISLREFCCHTFSKTGRVLSRLAAL